MRSHASIRQKPKNNARETEVSPVEEREFAICYQKLIAHYRLTPEQNGRQLAGILRRIGEPGHEPHSPEGKEEKKAFRRNQP